MQILHHLIPFLPLALSASLKHKLCNKVMCRESGNVQNGPAATHSHCERSQSQELAAHAASRPDQHVCSAAGPAWRLQILPDVGCSTGVVQHQACKDCSHHVTPTGTHTASCISYVHGSYQQRAPQPSCCREVCASTRESRKVKALWNNTGARHASC